MGLILWDLVLKGTYTVHSQAQCYVSTLVISMVCSISHKTCSPSPRVLMMIFFMSLDHLFCDISMHCLYFSFQNLRRWQARSLKQVGIFVVVRLA